MNGKSEIIVDTRYGKLKGTTENGLYVFKGIPYASPPTGEKRWLPPQPPVPWSGIRDATDYATIAPQPESRLGMISEFEAPEPQSEDCLFLNIWTPGLDNSRRPVMFWIHGGAFSMGSGSQPMYRGGELAKAGNIVLVTINYRLGVLGFLNLNEVTGGRIPATGNEGLLDQIQALKWVKENIIAFGGDPENITIFGESAGGMSIGCLLAMPAAKGLFKKAIIESTVGDMAMSLESAVKTARVFLDIIGISPDDVSSLRSLKVEQLLQAHQELAMKTGGMAPVIPVADGKVLPDFPLKVLRKGFAREIPVIVGNNLDEQKLFWAVLPDFPKVDESGLKKRVAKLAPANFVDTIIETYRAARAKRGESTEPVEILSAILTDITFRLKAIAIAEAQCKNGQSAYNYLFTWQSPALGGRLGACHALEIGFLFGNRDEKFCGAGPEADELSAKMKDAWLAFARTGNPSCKLLGKWPAYCEKRETMILGRTCRVEVAPYEDERRIWETIGEDKIRGSLP